MHWIAVTPFSGPAPWQGVMAVAALAALLVWVAAWRAGGSWRHWSGVLALAIFAVPWMQWGYAVDGIRGVVAGYLLALLAGQNMVAIALLIVAVGAVFEKNHIRVFTRVAGALLVQYLVLATLLAEWQWALRFAGTLAVTVALDAVFRPGGSWDRRGVPWLQRHEAVGIGLNTLGMTAYPAFVVWWFHQGPAFLRQFVDGTAAAIPVHALSAEWLFPVCFALWVIPFGIAIGLKGRSETGQALAAGVPFTVWAILAFALHASARDFVTFGLLLTALLGIATWAGVVLRSKTEESQAPASTWVAERGAMVYIGPVEGERDN